MVLQTNTTGHVGKFLLKPREDLWKSLGISTNPQIPLILSRLSRTFNHKFPSSHGIITSNTMIASDSFVFPGNVNLY